MVDILNLKAFDVAGVWGSCSFFVPDHSPESIGIDLKTLVQAGQLAATDSVTQTITTFTAVNPVAYNGETPYVSQAAELEFKLSDTSSYFAYLLAPLDGTFLIDGTVDETVYWIANLIAYVLANCVSSTGLSITSYETGKRVEMTPGFLAVNGAAAETRRGGMVADFYAQDGVDVVVDE